MESVIGVLNAIIWEYVLVTVLLGLGLYFSVRLKFAQFTYIPEMFRVLFDKRAVSAKGKKRDIPVSGVCD